MVIPPLLVMTPKEYVPLPVFPMRSCPLVGAEVKPVPPLFIAIVDPFHVPPVTVPSCAEPDIIALLASSRFALTVPFCMFIPDESSTLYPLVFWPLRVIVELKIP